MQGTIAGPNGVVTGAGTSSLLSFVLVQKVTNRAPVGAILSAWAPKEVARWLGNHWPLWVRGNYSDAAQMVPEYAGVVDWGETYAFMSFPIPRKKGSKDYKNQPTRQILFGWTYEDDNNYGLLAKGWNGAFTLPRDMFVKKWTVRDPRAEERGSWGIVSRSGSSYDLETLGSRPAEEVDALMNESKTKWSEKSWTYSGSGLNNGTWKALSKQPKSRFYVLSATLAFNTETIRVDRSKSSLVTGFNLGPEAGKLRLWNVPSGKGNGTKLETLDLKVFVDNSIVEIYANDVFAMTTRIYPWRDDSNGLGYYTSGSSSVKYSNVKVWEGLTNAWPSDLPTRLTSLFGMGPMCLGLVGKGFS
ncbi:Glycosyl hydrolases family 32 [Rhizoctonia solani]|uniref:Glycosyl hydrolases family 32 n=1 Tax=Rhizoctonia solani TaxID=456999 RepID=A0A8H7M6J3_9AGAM|nr:Glycosyl hydrolases family 32 [Rhizoctonia solani]